MQNLILYNYFRSSTSYRVRIALHFKNVPFEYRAVHLLKNGGEQHAPEYRKISPMGEVPTLLHNGKAIAQSLAIIEYLDEIYPQNKLFPDDPFLKAQVRQFCENINAFIHPLMNLKVLQYLEKNYNFTQNDKTKWVHHWVGQGFSSTEKMLQENSGKYCFGDQISAADLFLIPAIFSSQRFQMDMSPYPLMSQINKDCISLEYFKKAHPSQQPDFEP